MLNKLRQKNNNNNNNNNDNGTFNNNESEVETLQNALQEAMLRERQLIQEKAQKEDEMKQQRDATKQYIEVLMREKKELKDRLEDRLEDKTQPIKPSQPPPSTPSQPSPLKQLENELEQNKKDLQRVLQKLSIREHEHNQFNEEILKLRVSLKEKINENTIYRKKYEEIEKNYRITCDQLETTKSKIEKATKDQQEFHETQTLLESITNELKSFREKNKIIQQEKENLRDELNDKNDKINQLNVQIEKLNLENRNLNGTIQELTLKLEDLSKKGKQQIDELINNQQIQKQEINQLNQTINNLNNDIIKNDKIYNENMDDLNEKIKEINNNNLENENKYKQEIDEKDRKINEIEIEFKIKEKKKNKLIKELQEQLKKEVIKSQELKCKVLNLNDELIDIKQKNEKLIIENETKSLSSSSSLNGVGHKEYHKNGKQKPSKFVEKEVSGALAKKLEIEVKSNFALKEQIKYLTQSIQQLHIDLDNKKTVISNLTKRIDIGALPSSLSSKKYKNNNNNDKQQLIAQLQLLMQETTLQNSMLRKDLELMGKELEKSHNKIKTLTATKTNQ